MKSGIYKIQSIIKPDRIYIGSAANLGSRRRSHFNELKFNKHHNVKLQRHVNKYGIDDLVFSIVACCDKKELIPDNNVIWIEQCFLWAYKHENSNIPWFNICPIAGSSAGIKRRPETIRRGFHHTEETKQKMRHPASEEAKRNMSIGRKGRKVFRSKEHNKKISEALKGRQPSSLCKEKQHLTMVGRKQSPQEIERRRKSLTGKKRTPEQRKHQSDARFKLPIEIRCGNLKNWGKLTDDIIEGIKVENRNKEISGKIDREIAEQFNVSVETVRKIRKEMINDKNK